MKKILVFSLIILISKIGFAQNWTKKADLADSVLTEYSGTYGVCGGTTFTLGDTGYIVSGANFFNFFSYTFVYVASTNTWDTVATFPYTEGGYNGGGVKAGFALNDKGYVGTGSFFGQPLTKEFYEYDPSTDTWIQKAFMSVQRGYGIGFAIEGRGFIGLGNGGVNVGSSGSPLHDLWEYNPNEGDSGTWIQVQSYPGEGNNLCFAFTIGDKAYVGGGVNQNTNQACNDFWSYDTLNGWLRVKTFPGGSREGGASASTCNKGYIGLGQSASGTLFNDYWEFDPTQGDSGTWTQIATIPIPPGRSTPEAFSIGKSIFTGMGSPSGSTAIPDMWELTPQSSAVSVGFTADTAVCDGGSITFTDTSGFSPDHWFWQFPGGTPDTSTQPIATVTYDTAGYHNVILTAWDACGDTGKQTFTNYVHVGAGGVLTFQPPTPTVCNGQSVTIGITNDNGDIFTWTPGASLIDSTLTADSVMASPTATTTYTVTGPGTGGCGFTGSVVVTVNSAPPLFIQPQYPTLCDGFNITLTVPSSGSNYNWNPSTGLNQVTGDSVVANPTATSTYVVNGTDSLGCSVIDTDIITVTTPIVPPTMKQNGDTIISSYSQNNTWTMDGTVLTNYTDSSIIITVSGWYQVTETNSVNGCSATSDSEYFQIEGIAQLSLNNQVTIYPNPTGGIINVNVKSTANGLTGLSLQVTDVLGRTLYVQPALNYFNQIDLSAFSSGVYFISVKNKIGDAVFKVIKQN